MSGAEIAADVADALRQAGDAVGSGPYTAQLLRPGEPLGPKHTPYYPDPTPYDCVLLEESKEKYQREGSLVEGTEWVFTAADLTVEPKTTDQLRFDGEDRAILKVMPFRPAGVPIYWILMVSA